VEQISEGILNLTHRVSHEAPSALEAGHVYEVRVSLRAAGYRVPRGHRIQLSVASAHWPVIWPSAGAGQLSIHHGSEAPSRLELPLAPIGAELVEPPAFRAEPPDLQSVGDETSEPARWDARDDPDGSFVIDTHEGETSTLPDGVSTLYVGESLTMSASSRTPGSGSFENACEYRLDKDGHRIRVLADGTHLADAEAVDMRVRVRVELDTAEFFSREWHETIARDLL
jgi:hypothetical protein